LCAQRKNQEESMLGVELFVQELKARGIPFIATTCGHGLNDLHKACEDAGLKLIDVRNEQAAGYMADAAGRLSRQVGVCAVSSGVAHINAMTGMVNAYFDGAPSLFITGSAATKTMGKGHFQDLDQVALAAPVCKYARTIDRPDRIRQFVHEAFAAALSGRPGPVHLTFPMDIQAAEVSPEQPVFAPAGAEMPSPQPDPLQVASLVQLLSQAERPLLIAGTGLYYAGGEEALASFAKALSIPVVVPIWDRGCIPQPSNEFVGMVGAATGGPRLLADADVIFMLGAACDYRVGYLQAPAVREDARIVRIDVDPGQLHQGPPTHIAMPADPRCVLEELTSACSARGIRPGSAWLTEARARQQVFRQACIEARQLAEAGLHALDILEAVRSVLTDDTMLLIDGGNVGQWFHQVLIDRYPGHWVTCGASAVVGYGIPGAMAARALYPNRPVILISGDGSLTFTVAELESAARQRLGFVILLADDQAWGITLTEQRRKYGHGITSELGPIEYAKMAEAFGAHGVRVSSPADLVPAIRRGLSADRPTLIHVPVVRSNPADR
jgi:acetolactate synthase-1/2/3 large subunit